jgi:hypothetical protein
MSSRNGKLIKFLGSKLQLVRRTKTFRHLRADCLDNVGSLTFHNLNTSIPLLIFVLYYYYMHYFGCGFWAHPVPYPMGTGVKQQGHEAITDPSRAASDCAHIWQSWVSSQVVRAWLRQGKLSCATNTMLHQNELIFVFNEARYRLQSCVSTEQIFLMTTSW